ncbi:MAG: sulfatase-like hydrolase/transferase [Deltaproteobacteria bacterium]|nr:sulfatase-like hydrolase/transferase [Deltaproteobacteria bacterium]
MTRFKGLLSITFIASAALCFFWFGAVSQPGPFRRVVFVTIDTLRADHLQSYGYPRPTSPFLAELADKGYLFTNAYSASSHTAPSHASMFTGVFPFQHGVLSNGQLLSPEVFTVAKAFKDRGYLTAEFSSVSFMENLFGFDVLGHKVGAKDRPSSKKKRGKRKRFYRPADRQVNLVKNWLRRISSSDNFFLWLHFYDVHQWDEKSKMAPEYAAKFAASHQDELLEFLKERHGLPAQVAADRERVLRMVNNYDGLLLFVDEQLRRLYRFMDEAGLNREALWIITSDHGEGLGNHNYDGHGEKIYKEQLHVPLIIHRPGGQEHKVFHELVRTVDLFPTLVSLSGYSLPEVKDPAIQGVSLHKLIESPTRNAWPVVYSFAQRRPKGFESYRRDWEDGDHYALQDRNFKYIFHSESEDEFFDINKDPFELNNLIGTEHASHSAEMLAKLKEVLQLPRVDGGFQSPSLSTETLKELQALGYL